MTWLIIGGIVIAAAIMVWAVRREDKRHKELTTRLGRIETLVRRLPRS